MSGATCLVAFVGATLILGLPAQAAGRIWVSGHGSDVSGCGAPTNPCRSFQYAHDNIASGGEIDVLDPAGYGAVTIAKAISIVNDGVGTAGVQATSGNAITINAGVGDAVHLRGLSIEGVGSGGDGIHFNTGASLDVIGCRVHGFQGAGIGFYGSGKATIRDVSVSDNGRYGILFQPGDSQRVTGTITRATLFGNGDGVDLVGLTNGLSNVTIVDSVALNNGYGVRAEPGVLPQTGSDYVTLRNVTIANNATGVGLSPGGLAIARIAHSVINGNGTGVGIGGGAVAYTFQDNNIDGNATNVSGSLTPDADK